MTFSSVLAADGYFVVGDGSGGGGAGGNQGMNGAAGGGGSDTLDYSATSNPNVIFGDGSGGGAGGRGVGFTNNVVVGGAGGGGADTLTGGSVNDIIFGDGFSGGNTVDGVFYPGWGGLGGGGGGGAGGGFGGPPGGAGPGLCGGGGGGGTHGGGTANLLVACSNSTKGTAANGASNGGNGGNAATPESGSQGLGGAYSGPHGGGGGGFGGASGGTGVTAPTAGNTTQYRITDTGNTLFNYFTEAVLRSVLTNYPNYGAGQDIINGKGGSNELFGLGGNDTFIVDSVDVPTRNRIWDFSAGDSLILKTNGTVVATVDVNSVVAGATQGDYDNDGTSDDTRIVFGGTNIDLVNVITIQTDASGQLSTPNTIPTLALADANLAYTVSASATQVDAAATASDANGDSDWNGGTLTAQISANANGSDVVSLSGTNIEITGTTLKYSGASVGTVSAASVTGSTVLTVTWNSGATNAIVQTMARNIRFYTTVSGSADRVVRIVVTDKNGGSAEDTRGIDVSGAPAITYYTVSTSVGNGGSVSPSSRSVASGATDSFTVTASAGYSINTVTGCSGNVSGTTYTTGAISGDCTVTASFSANNYSVTFNSLGGDAVATITQAYGTNVVVPSATRTGYTLASWNTQSGGGGTSYNAGQTIAMPVNGLLLYAQWTLNTYSVTYNGNGNTGGSAPMDASSPYSHNTLITVLENTGHLVRTGYTFNNWNTAVDGSGTAYVPTDTFAILGNITLFAQWTATADMDNDGISNATENLAPNGGDGNGDGVLDRVQADVTSIENAVTGSTTTLSLTSGCSFIVSYAVVTENSLGTDGAYDFPLGLNNFQIQCTTPGETATVKIYYTQTYDTTGWNFRKYINNSFVNLSSFVSYTVEDIDPGAGTNTVTVANLTLTDDGPFDADPTDAVISDPSGPSRPVRDDTEDEDDGYDLKRPKRLSVECFANKTAKLKWTDTSRGEDGYKIHRRIQGGDWNRIRTTTRNKESFRDDDPRDGALLPGQTYEWRIRSFKAGDRGAWSRKSSCTIPVTVTPGSGASDTPAVSQAQSFNESEAMVVSGMEGKTLALRSLPNVFAPTRQVLTEGEELSAFAVSQDGKWYNVITVGGREGWVSVDYIKKVE